MRQPVFSQLVTGVGRGTDLGTVEQGPWVYAQLAASSIQQVAAGGSLSRQVQRLLEV